MSGQIIATSHDLTLKWWFSKGNPLVSDKSRLVKYDNLARYVCQWLRITMAVNHVSFKTQAPSFSSTWAPGIGITIGSMAFLWCPVWTVKYIFSRLGDYFDIFHLWIHGTNGIFSYMYHGNQPWILRDLKKHLRFETGWVNKKVAIDFIFEDDGSFGEQKTQISQRLCN